MTDGGSSHHLAEYEKLKEEQGRRIHFRDNMRYVMFVAAGFVFSKAGAMPLALLAIPWMCSVLGWTYVANMRQVCRIRTYLKENLAGKVGEGSFRWEHEAQQQDHKRRLLVDEITFVGPGIVALVAFLTHHGDAPATASPLVALEAALLLWIGWEIAHPRESRRFSLREQASLLQRAAVIFWMNPTRPSARSMRIRSSA
jgi:hypothetical protein